MTCKKSWFVRFLFQSLQIDPFNRQAGLKPLKSALKCLFNNFLLTYSLTSENSQNQGDSYLCLLSQRDSFSSRNTGPNLSSKVDVRAQWFSFTSNIVKKLRWRFLSLFNYKLLIRIVSCFFEMSSPHERIHMWPSECSTTSNMIIPFYLVKHI